MKFGTQITAFLCIKLLEICLQVNKSL